MANDVSSEPSSTATDAPSGRELERELDRISLEQALRDFEIANARTIDITQRLVDLTKEVGILRERLIAADLATEAARLENEAIRASVTFRAQAWLDRLRSFRRR